MATPVTSLKWRLQFRKESLSDERIFYIEYNSDAVTKVQLADLVKSLDSLGYRGASFGLIVSLP